MEWFGNEAELRRANFKALAASLLTKPSDAVRFCFIAKIIATPNGEARACNNQMWKVLFIVCNTDAAYTQNYCNFGVCLFAFLLVKCLLRLRNFIFYFQLQQQSHAMTQLGRERKERESEHKKKIVENELIEFMKPKAQSNRKK